MPRGRTWYNYTKDIDCYFNTQVHRNDKISSNEKKSISSGDEILLLYGTNVLKRTVSEIIDDNVYWDDADGQFSFAPISKFVKLEDKYVINI